MYDLTWTRKAVLDMEGFGGLLLMKVDNCSKWSHDNGLRYFLGNYSFNIVWQIFCPKSGECKKKNIKKDGEM